MQRVQPAVGLAASRTILTDGQSAPMKRNALEQPSAVR